MNLLLFAELEAKQAVVVIDYVEERGKAAVGEETSPYVRKQFLEEGVKVQLPGRVRCSTPAREPGYDVFFVTVFFSWS